MGRKRGAGSLLVSIYEPHGLAALTSEALSGRCRSTCRKKYPPQSSWLENLNPRDNDSEIEHHDKDEPC